LLPILTFCLSLVYGGGLHHSSQVELLLVSDFFAVAMVIGALVDQSKKQKRA
jgi:hypothetical protein